MSALKAIQERKAAEALASQQAAEKQREEFKTPEEKEALAKADGNTAEANVALSAAGKSTPSEKKLEEAEIRLPKELLNTPIPTLTDEVNPLTQLHTEHLSQIRTGMEGSTEALGYRFGTRDEFLVTPHTEEIVVDPNNIPEHTYKMGKVRRIVLSSGKAVEADKNGYIIGDTVEKREILDHFVSQNRGLAETVPATVK